MKVAKRFRWEGAHRLPWHTEGCQHLHGHSYQLWVELTGEATTNGMLIDFKAIKEVLAPLIAAWDHAILVDEADQQLRAAIDLLASKHYVLPYDTTSENLCQYVADYLLTQAAQVLADHDITAIGVKLQETETCYAELTVPVGVSTNPAAKLANKLVTSF